ncbi:MULTISPECIES: SMP-30/gluconolactonase/LRE family protein [unclassified Micromonospora]|uniref:SMP-30/gluconolactonase/LRE family protein n=1 Tax=unclassified Micromonospora TaxID=2617518 RepID=UPI0036342121
MRKRMITAPIAAAVAGLVAVTVWNTGTGSAAVSGPPAVEVPAASVRDQSATPAALRSRIALHFDLARGQTPENIALAPDGTAYVTFAGARQVASIDRDGGIRTLATLAVPADGGVNTPVLKFALTTGIVRHRDGTLYFLYASGDAASTGLYRLRSGGTPRRIASLPAAGLPNGLAFDEDSGTFYITDSVLGTISTVRQAGGRVTVWSSAPELAATGFLGVNGIKFRNGAVWATNLDQGTLLRIPVDHGRPAKVEVRACGLTGIDDFSFAGNGTDHVIAALVGRNTVAGIDGAGRSTTLLTAADGLQSPTSVAVHGRTVYVTSAAYQTATDPNLILATLPRR